MLHLDTARAFPQDGFKALCAKAVRLSILLAILMSMSLSFDHVAAAQSANSLDNGDAKTLFERGKAFHDGDGVERDLVKARDFYLQAASAGNDFAQINLGYMAFVGEGTAQDYPTSMKWYEQAANSGSYDAQSMMAVFYKNGLGVKADTVKADLWADRAARGWMLPATPKPIPSKPAAPKATAPAPKPNVETPANEKKLTAVLLSPKPEPAKSVSPLAIAPRNPQKISNPINPVPTPIDGIRAKPRLTLAAIAIAALIAFLAFVKIFGAISRARLGDDSKQFAELFYSRNAQILKNSYHRASSPEAGRGRVLATDINDQWVISVSLMMIRFAQMQETLTGSRSATSESLIAALRDGPIDARRAALPLIPKIKAIIETGVDNEGLDTSQEALKTRKKLSAFNWPRFTAPLPGAMSPAE